MVKNIVDTLSQKPSSFYYYHLNSVEYSNLTIYDCGYEKYSKHLKVVRDNYPYYLMHCVLNGSGILRLNGKETRIGCNEIFVIPPGVKAEYFQDTSDPWSYIYINFNGTAAVQFFNEAGFSIESPNYHYRSDQIREQFYELINAKIQQKHILFIYSVLTGIMANVIEENGGIKPDKNVFGFFHLDTALGYIKQHYHRPDLTLQSISSELGLNPSYFSRLFHRMTGSTFLKYLTMFRIQKSTTLLIDSKLSIKEIAHLVGFENALYFSAIFKQYRLMSPSEYRLKNQMIDQTPLPSPEAAKKPNDKSGEQKK